jgi:hypothetical protein
MNPNASSRNALFAPLQLAGERNAMEGRGEGQ